MATMHSPRSALPDRPGGAGAPPTHHLRTTVVAVGVTLAAAATVAGPLAMRGGGEPAATAPPAAPSTQASTPVTPGAEPPGGPLVGDVDGEGTPDTVTLARPDRLTV